MPIIDHKRHNIIALNIPINIKLSTYKLYDTSLLGIFLTRNSQIVNVRINHMDDIIISSIFQTPPCIEPFLIIYLFREFHNIIKAIIISNPLSNKTISIALFNIKSMNGKLPFNAMISPINNEHSIIANDTIYVRTAFILIFIVNPLYYSFTENIIFALL